MKYENNHQRKDVNTETNSNQNKSIETSIVEQMINMEAFFNVRKIMEIKSNIENPLALEQGPLIGDLPTTVNSDC